ncbi:MAG: phage terminase large subunit [Planctomycetes bacterium]|nr:phage terminase large subunit [Planctomycetota bacterium]
MSDRDVLKQLLRQDLSSFIQKVFQTVSPADVYRHNWHIDAIAWALQQCLEGKIRRLIITLPPRSLKSIAVSVAFPAYVLGREPRQKIVCVSYSQELADKHARDCRAVIGAAWYRVIFPRTRIDREKNTPAEFMTTWRGFRLATSVSGTLVGRGGNIHILDDVLKPDEALSEVLRTRVIEWYRSTLATRPDDKTRDVIIVIQQRVHEEDLVGFLLEQEGWTHLNLPAIAEERQVIPLGPQLVHLRQEGDVLHPAREPHEGLMRLKAEMGSYAFAAQYQQSPAPRGGGIVKWVWFQTCDVPPEKGSGDLVVQSWDTASKAKEYNDYSVCTTWLVRDKNYYLLHVLRQRLEYPALRKMVIAQRNAFEADEVLVEEAGSGIQLVQDLRSEGIGVRGIKPEGEKEMRMQVQTAVIEARRVFVPKAAPWLMDFQDEVTKFPAGKHDDQVDSLSQFLKWVSRPRRYGPRIRSL